MRNSLKMLEPLRNLLSTQHIVLASQSPRRKNILENVNFPFEVQPSQFKEDLDKAAFANTEKYVVATADGKALEVANRLKSENKKFDLIIACDTAVTFRGEVLEKPQDRQDASLMLNKLQGKTHEVCSGVVLISGDKKRSFSETTRVTLLPLSQTVIDSYIDTGEPLDKAGGYGIQSGGGTFVSHIDGCYFNVVGFPLSAFCTNLIQLYTDLGLSWSG